MADMPKETERTKAGKAVVLEYDYFRVPMPPCPKFFVYISLASL